MTFILSLRRSLLVLVMAAGLCLGSLPASGSAAHVQAPATPRTVPASRTFEDSPLAHLRHVLHALWAAVGSSMDPLGIH